MKRKDKQKSAGNSRKCKKCGGNMRQIDGTNAFVCEGFDKDGKPCGQYFVRRIFGFNDEDAPCYKPRKKVKQSSS